MTQEPYLFLIAQPGHLRDSLEVLLATLTGRRPAVLVSDWPVRMLNTIHCQPDLVLAVLEPGSLGIGESEFIAQTLIRWPQARLVALVDSELQRRIIISAGADRVWLKGILAAQILSEIEALLRSED